MKTKKTRILLILLACLPASAVPGQSGNLDLHVNPDIHSRKIASVSIDDPRLGEPAPVLDDAKAALGWQFAEFQGTVDGYVPDAKIGKDMLPVDDTVIRLEPDPQGQVLGVYRFGDPIEIIDTGIWWKIQVRKPFTVYFLADTLSPVALATGAPTATGTAVQVDTSAGIIDDTTLFKTSVEPATGGIPPVSVIQKEKEPRQGIEARSFTGLLRKSKNRVGIFRAKAPYYLVGDTGKRLLWVSFGDTIMPGTINLYIGRNVIIHGEPVQDEKSKEWILHVLSIRENR